MDPYQRDFLLSRLLQQQQQPQAITSADAARQQQQYHEQLLMASRAHQTTTALHPHPHHYAMISAALQRTHQIGGSQLGQNSLHAGTATALYHPQAMAQAPPIRGDHPTAASEGLLRLQMQGRASSRTDITARQSMKRPPEATAFIKATVSGPDSQSMKKRPPEATGTANKAITGGPDKMLHLRKWIEGESKNIHQEDQSWKTSILHKVKVAYGVAELIKKCRLVDYETTCDHFAVHCGQSNMEENDVKGVAMVSTGLTTSWCNGNDVKITPPSEDEASASGDKGVALQGEEDKRRHLLGRILFEIFTHQAYPTNEDIDKESSKKKTKTSHALSRKGLMLSRAKGDFFEDVKPNSKSPPIPIAYLHSLRNSAPAPLFEITQSLLENGGGPKHKTDDIARISFEVVCQDLHLLLLDPERFLFEREMGDDENVPLRYKKEKMYGRDEEESLMTKTFCRVLNDRSSEAFLVGGFSGSGKTKLVNRLRDRVNAVGGYVLMHKFDEISKERPLFGVISALNQLCLMVKRRNTPEDVLTVANKLKDVFGDDCWLLASVLPNVSVLSSDFSVEGKHTSETMNLRSVCYTLLRFVRVISSPAHPIMVVFDDMQWSNSTALDAVHAILSDTRGSCIFFVGTYRDNEVQEDHAIFQFIDKLDVSNVPTTKMSLTGLNQEDLNTMMSDALCLYPRICKSLSDVIFQKTKGNPFFVLEFVQSLRDRGLLKYNPHQKRWVWNVEAIQSEEITDNVQHLLSSKLKGLSESMQAVLKVMACFGTSTNESVISQLSETKEYSNIRDGIKCVVSDGFVEKDSEGGFKFVHDKIREAAYNLIPDSDKNQFHYDLGKLLYSAHNDDSLCHCACQLNHGFEFIMKDKAVWRIEVAELNIKVGKRALDRFIYTTALTFFENALSLLPDGHWETHYNLSLQLYLLMASASHSAGKTSEAYNALQEISDNARCIEDKLDSYFLHITILEAQGKLEEAFKMSYSFLIELGETLPDLLSDVAPNSLADITTSLAGESLMKLMPMATQEMLDMKVNEDKKLSAIIKLYNSMSINAFIVKSKEVAAFTICKNVKKCLDNGICENSPIAFVRYCSVIVSTHPHIACRIGKMAMSMSKRFGSKDQAALFLSFYAMVGWRVEPFRSCASNLLRGFESGLSIGDAHSAFHSTLQHIRFSFYSGENLQKILKDIDYYLGLMAEYNNEMVKNFMLIHRETLSTLYDKGEASSIDEKAVYANASGNDENVNADDQHFLTSYCYKIVQSFWLGHHDRCNHQMGNLPTNLSMIQLNEIYIRFYCGMNALQLLRKNGLAAQVKIYEESIAILIEAEENSSGSFRNKVLLMKAELMSIDRVRGAEEMYDAAIDAARMNGFVHEEGLACDRAAHHYRNCYNVDKRLFLLEKSWQYFMLAKNCYQKWGSKMKVNSIDRELEKLWANDMQQFQTSILPGGM